MSTRERELTTDTGAANRVTLTGLPATVKRYKDIEAIGGAGTTAAIALGVAYVAPRGWWTWVAVALAALALAAAAVEVLFLNGRLVRLTRIDCVDRGLWMRTGRWFWCEVSLCPESILSVEVAQGPLLRGMGLAKVTIKGIGSFPTLPPLMLDDARAVQRLLSGPASDS